MSDDDAADDAPSPDPAAWIAAYAEIFLDLSIPQACLPGVAASLEDLVSRHQLVASFRRPVDGDDVR